MAAGGRRAGRGAWAIAKSKREPDDVIFTRCIRCGSRSKEGLCPACTGGPGGVLRKLGRELCYMPDCAFPRLKNMRICRRHHKGYYREAK